MQINYPLIKKKKKDTVKYHIIQKENTRKINSAQPSVEFLFDSLSSLRKKCTLIKTCIS